MAARAIVNTSLIGVSESAIVLLPQLQSLHKKVTRERKNKNLPSIPHSLAAINLPDVLLKTRTHALFRHLCISGAMGSEHPNVYKLVDKLLDEQVRVKAICAKLAAGEDSPLYSRKEYEIKNRKLLSIIEAHDQMPADEYLEACGNYVVF
ncbi:hypothetical protein QR680_017424 [Steinernema hermaphroditum]|uniref:Uncharacterized protein n=1 Tax=Steinernema hermaphroditum TaxID=289476 RepID=A0AA39HGN1_9BILA|nr:hypothetical protein QR680_017424 [Steinernema hermaphroditum]